MSQWTPTLIVQAVIAVVVVVTICVMAALGREVPKELWTFFGFVLGWFGAGGAEVLSRALVRKKS